MAKLQNRTTYRVVGEDIECVLLVLDYTASSQQKYQSEEEKSKYVVCLL